MTKKYNSIVEWLEDVEPREFYKSNVVSDLSEYDIEVGYEYYPSGNKKITLAYNGRDVTIKCNSWEEDFEALKRRGLPFFLFDDQHVGEPKTYETSNAGYTVMNPKDLTEADFNYISAIGAGFIYKTEETVQESTISGSAIYWALAKLIAGKTPGDEFHGRGSAARANLNAIREAMPATMGANEIK